MNQSFPFIMLSPAFWLCLGMLGITLVMGLREFISAEIRNRYLTTNLEQEVERQTQSLQNILSERDKMLLYVSHDMKKTVIGINDSLTDLRQNLSAPVLIKKVDFLLQKSSELKKILCRFRKVRQAKLCRRTVRSVEFESDRARRYRRPSSRL